MTRAAMILLSFGTALFVALLAWQGIGAIGTMLAAAGWGLLLVAAFHIVPLIIDAGALHVLVRRRTSFVDALLARWAGESVNSLLPAGQLGGPVVMARHLAQRGAPMRDAAAAVTVGTTMQALAQIAFALLGLGTFAVYAGASGHPTPQGVRTAAVLASIVLALALGAFYVAQRRGLFGRFVRTAARVLGKRDWSALAMRADAIDDGVRALYGDRRRVAATFALSLVGWLVGVGEVWLALAVLGHPVDWLDALLLESVGQAIRGAAFAIPGSLGAQEGGYLLLAPIVGLAPDTALALSLAKRARELVLGLPGILYLHWSERNWQRRRAPGLPLAD
ncbi:flippase-like domain-containing protein [Trinickia fusca]|uniref:TIGR00374 family protein n=1 Tax=Trinickia fusca TaxID=2419777 RepID=A0A494X498_9BURK|nr:flippase-like domain-containing protein [Trinickia fusca]RKP45170.1 TIGR00374 family protein [Trinickia fusca]